MAPAPDLDALPGERRNDTWVRWIVGWHVAFWLLIALVLLRVLISGDLSRGQRLAEAGVAALLSAAYLLLVQPGWSRDPRGESPAVLRGRHAYLTVAVLAMGVACGVDPSLSMLLFIAYPHTWMLTRSRTAGAVYTTALTAAALAGFLSRYGWSPAVLRDIGPQMLVSLLFSLLLGMWIWRVLEQSGERAELIAELESTRSELSAAEHARGVTAERERLAREIHDTLAQGFTSIVMLAQAASAGLDGDRSRLASQLASIEDVARENLAEARALVAAFAPVGLDGSTLSDALRRLVQRFAQQTGVRVDLQLGDGVVGLNRAQEVVALRAAQEALANVRRHARAHRVTVRLVRDGEGVRVEVGDDGVGFGPQAPSGGFGLEGIRSRVSEVGGRLDVDSSPGGGTRVTVLLPGPPGPAGSTAQEAG